MERPTVFQYRFAGHPLRYRFRDPVTRLRFRPLPSTVKDETWDIHVSDETFRLGRNFLPADASIDYVEYRCLIEMTGRALLRWRCSIFHSVSFVWQGRAWLLAAPSGVGKTTQYLNWQRLFPGEIEMISGDMPVIEAREDWSVWVWPSPWNGKEGIRSHRSAPLGGIVLLEQAQVDQIRPLSPREAIVPLLHQFMALPETREEILSLTQLLERMLCVAPVWLLRDLGGDASTKLLRKTLAESIREGGAQKDAAL